MRAVVEIHGRRYELYRANEQSVQVHRELGARVLVVHEGRGPSLRKTSPASSPEARARRAAEGGTP
jgi:sugar phosphate isomerase/epimerase